MNFLLIILLIIPLLVMLLDYQHLGPKYGIFLFFSFAFIFGVVGGLNYVFFGEFTLWNKKDETE